MSVGQGNCSLKTAFGFSFAHRLVAAASGSFDESGHEQLVVGTETGKICLQGSESVFHVNDKINFLSVYKHNRKIKEQSIKSSDNSEYDIVIIGTNNSLMAFDVFNNKTIFHREITEGVNFIKIGNIDEYKNENVIICGCGTTIWGFQSDGKDLFWTALGDQINVLELCDMDGDGLNELIVGTDGIEIKVLKNASFFAEFDEGDPTLAIIAIKPATFAFGLSSGVVGVYGQGERLWRVKTKSRIVSLLSFPDQNHVACVWQNAKSPEIDIRSVSTGEIRTKDQLEGGELSIAFLVDLAGVGPLDSGEEQPQLTLVFKNGQVRALEFRSDPSSVDEGQQLREINQRKHALLEELRVYERPNAGGTEDPTERIPLEYSMVPVGTSLSCILDLTGGLSSTFSIGRSSISSNMSEISGAIRERESLCLRLTLSNEVPIRAALLFAEGIFDSECYTVHPNGKESAELNVNFCPAKNVFAELFIKVFAGYSIERQLRVFEVNQVLPRFVTFVQIDQSIAQQKPPECFVSFRFQSRIDQLRLWICENFAFVDEEKLQNEPSLVSESEGNDGGKKLQLYFFCTRNQEMLYINWDLNSGEFQFRHNDIQNVTDLIQSMCANMNVRELRSRAHFPTILANVKNIVESMDERYQVNERLSSEMVERINFVRECVVRAEDMLVIRDFSDARKLYGRLTILNKELIGQKTVRMAARKELLDGLKLLNISIDQFARLRVGEPSYSLIQECRKAIANDNLEALPKLFEFGCEIM